ncbi:Plancitoxin-1 [Holothuria leucospilota]|uniref:Plancitoxin-1 n=1 Tax=Holothuria leucospilota TaxID=206669 RepID=A0A9Q0YEI9_HOLLE|nr:Plancitoxin-1 [Holothuria leucospilota]
MFVSKLSCPNNRYYVYKLPKLTTNQDPLIKEGVAFYYLDISQQNFKLSTASLKDMSQPVAQTLQQIYNSSPGEVNCYLKLFYSVNILTIQSQSTSGVVAYDDNNGFWMIHSVPKFPRKFGPYAWADNANRNGQSILCVSFKSDQMDNIAHQLLYNHPYVYHGNLPQDLLPIAQTFQQVVSGSFVPDPPFYKKVTLWSSGGQKFGHYAKYSSFGKGNMSCPYPMSCKITSNWYKYTK